LDRSNTFSSEEFLKVMRIIVLNEALAIKEAFLQVDGGQGTCPVDDPVMMNTIGKLTGVFASDEKIREVIRVIGHGERNFKVDQFKQFAESLRKSYGFTQADYDFYKSQFDYNDRDGSGAMSVVELGGLLSSMAIHLSLKERQAVLAIVDLSGDGELDFSEFLRLMSLIKKEETRTIMYYCEKQAKAYDYEFDAGHLNHPCFPNAAFTKLLKALKLGDNALEEYAVARELPRNTVWTIRDLFGAVETVRRYEMEQIRTNAGYSQEDVAEFKEKFAAMDRDNSGTMDIKELLLLLKEVNKEPRTFEEQQRLKEILEEIRLPDCKDLAINFKGFLRMMRFFNDNDTERMLENEAIAAKKTGYSKRDIDKYRNLFTTYSKNNSGTLTVADIRDIFRSNGMPITPDQLDVLREKCREITNAQENQSGMLTVQFDHFLLLIHDLRNSNFADINKNLVFD
jgi:Ca2+-binding EF-hand superfamily protein